MHENSGQCTCAWLQRQYFTAPPKQRKRVRTKKETNKKRGKTKTKKGNKTREKREKIEEKRE